MTRYDQEKILLADMAIRKTRTQRPRTHVKPGPLSNLMVGDQYLNAGEHYFNIQSCNKHLALNKVPLSMRNIAN